MKWIEIKNEDVDKTLALISDIQEIIPDIQKSAEAKTWLNRILSYIPLITKHLGKIRRLFKHFNELKDEIIDIDSKEAEQIYNAAMVKFGGNKKIKEAYKHFLIALAHVKQGVVLFKQGRENKSL
jgi:hypothetical protein